MPDEGLDIGRLEGMADGRLLGLSADRYVGELGCDVGRVFGV